MKKNKKLYYIVLALILVAALYFSANNSDSVAGQISQSVINNVIHDNGLQLKEDVSETEKEDVNPTQKPPKADPTPTVTPESSDDAIDEDGVYTSKEDVALYIHTYGKLPKNFITKKEAESKGWPGGSLEEYCPGMCIGGSYYGNYEGLLPKAKGREYHECDIDTLGARSRGAKRIVYSNDGLIYYTDDHYESFSLLYGDPDA